MIVNNPQECILHFKGPMSYLIEAVRIPEDFPLEATLRTMAERYLGRPLMPDDDSTVGEYEEAIHIWLIKPENIAFDNFSILPDRSILLNGEDVESLLLTDVDAEEMLSALRTVIRAKVDGLQKFLNT